MHSAGTQNVRAPALAASGAAAETAQPSPPAGSINGGESPDSFGSRGRGSSRGQGHPVSSTAEMSARGRGASARRGSAEEAKESRRGRARRQGGDGGGAPGPARHTGRAASAQLHRLQRARSRLRASRPEAPGGCRWGKRGTGAAPAFLPGCFALALPCPALPTWLRGPGPLTPSAAAPRRTGRPAGRRLPQRPPGSRGSARLGSGGEGAGPARREGAFKATHTPPSAQNRAREPGGLATLGSGLDWAPAGLEES